MEATPILIIEDEAEIRKFLRATLTANGFAPLEAETAKEGMKALTMLRPDAVILDLGLPDRDGQDVIRDVREWSQVPILVLSARGREAEKIMALENGADDYITKPFSAGELLARLKVAMRHALRRETGSVVHEINGLTLNLAERRVTLNGGAVHLTPIEYKLLSLLMQNAGKVLTHAQLVKEVWGRHDPSQQTYLRIHTQHLREKLGDDALAPRFIVTEAGVGYRFVSAYSI